MPETLKYLLFVLLLCSFACFKEEPVTPKKIFVETGKASWYGKEFQGKKTASGEKFDMNKATAAHKFIEFNTIVKVTNIRNGKSVDVKINDRGPVSKNRIIDLSKFAAEKLDLVEAGVQPVKLEIVGYESINLETLFLHYNNLITINELLNEQDSI